MTPKRIKQRYDDFEKALKRLTEAINEDPKKSDTVIDGTIQRFEFTFELAWKLTKAILEHNGVEANSPRAVIKESFSQGFIKDGVAWIQMLDDRNKTSHIYDEAQARQIYEKIKSQYHPLFVVLNEKLLSAVFKVNE